MPDAGTPRVGGLRPGDPQVLGAYRIVGRLGEGGMGSVYLAESSARYTEPRPWAGRPVALKVIRSELAHNAEFRRRFRSEVARARQVPPFCTAEVLDADTEHEPPFLVVEYVDGPSLSAVVEEHGPLSPANQHGIALGVAVALTAIHGAGVIHRDLKPSNVLLAPGSPKVIDFGIARDAAGTESMTRPDEVVGTVAYMAPERFEPAASQALTPAADVFAWGAVVAYAATGRTPFAADLPAAMAVRIMSQPPDLRGLEGPLRDLVERSLAKNPADRPTARELVDDLLAGGGRAAARPAAFTEQPEVLAAAGIAPTRVAAAPASTPRKAGVVYIPERRRSGRGSWIAIAALTLAVLVLAGTVVGIATGKIPLAVGRQGAPSGAGVAPDSGASIAPGAARTVRNSLAQPDLWMNVDDPAYDATCRPSGRLTVRLGDAKAGSYRCLGISDQFTDFSVLVDVELLNARSCAGIWFRYTNENGGYALRICSDRYELVTHVDGTVSAPIKTLFLGVRPAPLDGPVRVGIRAQENTLTFFRGDAPAQTVTDTQFRTGRVVLGVFAHNRDDAPPFVVAFTNIEIWT
jgi:hypothetical protein